MFSKALRGLLTVAVVLVVTAMSGGIPWALAASTTEVVTEDDVVRQQEALPPPPGQSWVIYWRLPTSTGAFRVGPGNPPLGIGSVEFNTPTAADKETLFNYDHIGTPLADINAMGYETYRTSGSLQQVTSINMQVDYNGPNVPGGFTTLVFEPVYNTDQGPVVNGVWQDWDAYNGGNAVWWSTRPIGGCPIPPCYQTWATIVANNPDAVILGGYGVNQGSGNPGLVAAVDALTIGYGSFSVTYDFEPYRIATTKEQCKQGGWQTVRRADGSTFRNQGDCIQYVNTGR